jgi:DNA polymerase-3 subunit epsilon
MNFLALDFETANEYRGSICAVGLVVVKDGKVTSGDSWLVRPKNTYFNPFNTAIHGITAAAVQNKPEFSELWNDLRAILNGRMIIAHNASFDMSSLRYAVADYSLLQAEFPYSCTRVIGRKAWPGLDNYRLDTVAEKLGITFKHHDALEDARAAAEIAIRACATTGATSIEELAERLHFRNGKIFSGGYTAASRLPRASRLKASELRPGAKFQPNANCNRRIFAFMGKLRFMTRQVAMQRVIDAGGKCCDKATANTHFLVVPDQDLACRENGKKTQSLLTAERIIAKGGFVKLIGECEFLRILSG